MTARTSQESTGSVLQQSNGLLPSLNCKAQSSNSLKVFFAEDFGIPSAGCTCKFGELALSSYSYVLFCRWEACIGFTLLGLLYVYLYSFQVVLIWRPGRMLPALHGTCPPSFAAQ